METSISTHFEVSGSYVGKRQHPGTSLELQLSSPIGVKTNRVKRNRVKRNGVKRAEMNTGQASNIAVKASLLLSRSFKTRLVALFFRNNSHVDHALMGRLLSRLNAPCRIFQELDSRTYRPGDRPGYRPRIVEGGFNVYFRPPSFFLFHHPVPTAIIC